MEEDEAVRREEGWLAHEGESELVAADRNRFGHIGALLAHARGPGRNSGACLAHAFRR